MDIIYNAGKIFLDYIVNCAVNDDFWKTTKLDHICYRAESVQEYTNLKNQFSILGLLFAENVVNGRQISIFKLSAPIQNEVLSTQWLELAAPKERSNHGVGFEHIELITPLNLRALVEDNPHLNFNVKNIDGNVPEIRLKFSKGVIKFRNKGIENIILDSV